MDIRRIKLLALLLCHNDMTAAHTTMCLLLKQKLKLRLHAQACSITGYINFDNLPEPSSTLFRFEVHELRSLVCALNIPDHIITCTSGYSCSSLKGIAIVLWRFAYPCRW